jgi:hypothetical protein
LVLPRARRFTDLGVQPRQRVVPPKPVEEMPREVSTVDDAPETGGPADGPH